MDMSFKKVSVIGAGTLGAQIAMLAAYAGYQVTMFDVRPGAFAETVERFRSDLKSQSIEPYIPWDKWDECKSSVRKVADLDEAVKDADLVIESVPENLALKREVWAELGRKSPPNAILATNSSSMPVSRMEESGGRPEKSLNIHFYMILGGMNMADVMGGSRTTPEVLQQGADWVRSLGFIPLTVKKELLGFCFNRVWRAIKKEVLSMWGNDYVDFRDLDRAWMIFSRMKVGPFGMMDEVGLDVIHAIEMVYYEDSKDERDKPPQALRDKVARGELGVKTKKGFYTYPDPEYSRPDFLKSGAK